MADTLLARPLVPVANREDAEHTLAAILPRLAANGGRMTVVNVIEKAGGAMDKAPLEQREELAEELFEFVREEAEAAGVTAETELVYGTDVAETIVEAAHEVDATAIVFTPREGKRWWDLFAPDVSGSIVEESDIPVVVLPDATPDGAESTDADADSSAAGGDTT